MTELTVRFAHAIDGYAIGQVVTLPARMGYRYISAGYAVDASGQTPTTPGGSGGGGSLDPAPVNPTLRYLRGDLTWQLLNKGAVGLSEVDNTADANKPVSNAQAAAIAAVGVSPPPATTFENAL
jgi:hypothetical protein